MSLKLIECQHVHELPERGSSLLGALGCFGTSASALWQNIARAFDLLSRPFPSCSAPATRIYTTSVRLCLAAQAISHEKPTPKYKSFFLSNSKDPLSQDGPW